MPKIHKKTGIITAKIEINDDFARALKLLENTNKNVFITGKAGTGKSTLLQYFREHTDKNVAVLAPTGVAALNVEGQTIHSFFRFPTTITPQTVRKKKPSKQFLELLKKLDAIVIDEVSMVRADMMDCIDEALRFCLKNEKPFGGLQMVFIGDLYQLPPVVAGREERELFKTYYKSPYFFDAKVFDDFEMEFIELEKIYRQKDADFIELLNKIRNNSIEEADIKKLNSRGNPDFEETDDFYITLTTTNAAADIINYKKLAQLGTKTNTFHGEISGEFDRKHYPTSLELELKAGAQIMLLNNDSAGRWVNGSVGKVIEIDFDEENGQDVLIVELSDGDEVKVYPYTWEVSQYFFNKKQMRLDAEVIGSFTQYPVRLAWAVTIHKSQGKTFDRVVIDIGKGSFAHGQVYVAISRCTSFEGLILKKPILKKHIWMDWQIVRFLTKYQYEQSEENMSLEDKIKHIQKVIDSNGVLDIVYLKANDTKSKRKIEPQSVGKMEYLGKPFIGVEGHCLERKATRVFRVDRILEIR